METTRLSFLDWSRTSAILLMVAYHLVYDLNRFAGVGINYEAPFWYGVGKTSALLFIFLSAFCSVLSRHPIRRGFQFLGYGLGISGVTFLFLPDAYVRFGILHFLGVALILSPFIRALPHRLLPVFAFLSGLAGWVCAQLTLPAGFLSGLLLPFGLKYQGFTSIDYFPLFPYLAITLLGIYMATAYLQSRPALTNAQVDNKGSSLSKILSEPLSKHSLKIYLIHQPVILSAIFTIRWIHAPRSGPSQPPVPSTLAHLFLVSFSFLQRGDTFRSLFAGPVLIHLRSFLLLPGTWLALATIVLGLLGYRLRTRRSRN